MTAEAPADRPAATPSRARRIASWLHSRPRTQLWLLLALPLAWLVIIYLGSLAILLLNAFWTSDSFTGRVVPFDWSLEAFEQIIGNEVYRTIALRTIGMALLVTVTDAVQHGSFQIGNLIDDHLHIFKREIGRPLDRCECARAVLAKQVAAIGSLKIKTDRRIGYNRPKRFDLFEVRLTLNCRHSAKV